MSVAAQLPTRRTEAWKYSDLRATLGDAPRALREGRDIIEQLAPETHLGDVAPGEQRLVVERFEDGAPFLAQASEWRLGAGASLTRIVVQRGAGPVLSIARVHVATGASFRQFVLAEGAKLARIETHVHVAGESAHVELNGVYLVAEGRHADLTSVIEHSAPASTTRQLIKGVARKGGRGVFQGKIVVERAAQRTDARQHHHGMLLQDGAEVFAKPELMIYADDVQCAHGNTAGGLDERALFYMRSRGIPEAEARALLIESFLVEAIPAELPEELGQELVGCIRDWLKEGVA